MRSYDLVVIGGGAAGFSALVRFSELTEGRGSVALITAGPLGGTCANYGCVPSKYLVEVAKVVKHVEMFRERGVRGSVGADLSRVFSALRGFVKSYREEKYERLLASYPNVDLYRGVARFASPGSVVVSTDDDQIEIGGKAFVVATGSRPSTPPVKGLKETGYLTTDTLWELEKIPGKVLVIGSGAVGLEISQAMSRLGVEVHVVEVLERPLPAAEPEVSREVLEALREDGVRFYLKSRIESVEQHGERKRARILTPSGPVEDLYEEILVAAGRRPNSDALDLEKAGVEVDERGFVKVGRDLRTGNPAIYAAGDVAGTPKPALLETLAAREGAVAAANIAVGGGLSIDYETVPVVVFTDPEVAMVGLTERILIERLGGCSCRVISFRDVPRSGVAGYSRGVAKLVVDPATRAVKGFHIVAPNASEYAAQASIMIREGYTVEKVIETIHAFPTSSESLKIAAQAFIRDVKRMPCCVE